MLNIVVYLLVYLFEMLVSYIVFSYVGSRRNTVLITLLIGLLFFEGGAIVNIACQNKVWVNCIYMIISMFLYAMSCFHIEYRIAAVYVLLMNVFMAAFEYATIFALSAMIGTETTEYRDNLPVLLIEAAISKTLYLTACVALVQFPRNRTAGRFPASFFLFPAGTLFSLISFWYISMHEELSYANQMLLAAVCVVLLGSTILLFIVYLHSMEKDGEYTQVKSENERLQMEKAHYDILERQNQQLMLYAHDAKNHLAAIQNLSADPCINAYIEKLQEQLGRYAGHCRSGNKILDVIINKYETECELHEIEFEYDVRSCNLNGVADIDLMAILGNLLDNALTAAGKSEQKFMTLETTTRNSYCVIIITNSCDREPIAHGNYLVTTKEEHRLHGFGLRSVRKTLKKYQGDFHWDYDAVQRLFIMTVMLRTAKRPAEQL